MTLSRRDALTGLIVTCVPKVPIWKTCRFNGLHFTQRNRGRFPGGVVALGA